MRTLFSMLHELSGVSSPEPAKPGIPYSVLSANIQSAGPARLEKIAEYLRAAGADIIVLSELQRKPVTLDFLEHLRRNGYAGLQISESDSAAYHVAIGCRLACRELTIATETLRDRTKLIRIESETRLSRVYIVGVYGPSFNSQNLQFRRLYKSDFEQKILERLGNARENVFIIGDMNIIESRFHDHLAAFVEEDRKFFASLKNNGFTDVVRCQYRDIPQYTWISPITGDGQRLDHFFARGESIDWISGLEIAHDFRYGKYSDHSAITFSFKLPL